jgi:hypothetical protein
MRYRRMMQSPVILACDVCDRKIEHGPHKYEGRSILSYDMLVCEPCWQDNWDGWAPARQFRVLEHLANKGIAVPPRNAKGWIPRGD